MRDCSIITLSNGIRVAHQYIATTKIVHCGIFLDVGSRDETLLNQGIAHFWEHMAFKGTRRRKSYHIINSLDAVGGELNAYTDKERVAFYASVRDEYFEKAVDILSDIAFDSVFPEKEIEKERGVILEEMSMYEDDPDDSIQDEFEATIFKDHPMGMNILGRHDTITTFQRNDFFSFYEEHLNTERIVFSVVGNVTLQHVEKMTRKYLDRLPAVRKPVERKKFNNYKRQETILTRPVKQARCAIGQESYKFSHEKRIPFYLLINMLGGPGMNSRLNLSLREKYGYVYSVDAHFVSFSDTGMFAVFFGTEPRQLDRCMKLIRKEMDRFCDGPLSDKQLQAAKVQLMGQLAMAEENNLSLMMMMGRSVIDLGRVPTLEEIFEKIKAISPAVIQDVAGEMFDAKKLSYLVMQPEA